MLHEPHLRQQIWLTTWLRRLAVRNTMAHNYNFLAQNTCSLQTLHSIFISWSQKVQRNLLKHLIDRTSHQPKAFV